MDTNADLISESKFRLGRWSMDNWILYRSTELGRCGGATSMLQSTLAARRVFRLARHISAPSTSYATAATARTTMENKDDLHASPVPPNPLGEGRWIRTAACLIIGCICSFNLPAVTILTTWNGRRDEILNGKTHDKNSNYFARFCFEQGIELCVCRQSYPRNDANVG